MNMSPTHRRLSALFTVMLVSLGGLAPSGATAQAPTSAQPPAVGDAVRDFTLNRIDGKPISLSALAKAGPVVMIMLRGWVGYQCPICSRQMTGFMGQAQAFQAAGANVVLVYPGSADLVQQKAEEFVTGKTLPERYHFVVDPDLKVVNLYGLRWDAPAETAYPSTFVIDTRGVVRFAKISRSHGDRSSAPDVLAVLQNLK
jgi:peroxiredoxin